MANQSATVYVIFSMETTGGFEECGQPLTALSRAEAMKKAFSLLEAYLDSEGAISADGKLHTAGFAYADDYGTCDDICRSKSNRFEFWKTDCSGIQVTIKAVKNPYRPDNG